ncbi:acyl carrier protein [Streptomyces scabiei]|uniref:acyl carrier protein n=1 Tax=Streptomyces scabiei TaxID=1930 RepID=UPI0029BE94C1|nr:phosphopantetheine-binding protein [Streptomyces scabiei]MDX3112513.1 phosphopantetheine-binding protein [Streptomyces scabiei]
MDPRFTDLLAPFLKFLGEEEITAETSLREQGLDSMQAIELLFAIEDAFGVALPDEAMNHATFATAGSLWKVISAASEADQAASTR